MSEYVAFVSALRVGRQMRGRMFDTIEQRHAHDFGNGKDGKRLYEELLSAIRASGAAEAVEEFESRFFPLLDPDKPGREGRNGPQNGPREEMTEGDRTKQSRRGLGWVSAVCVAAITLGAVLFGFNALKLRIAVRSNIAVSSVPAARATVPPSEPRAMDEPAMNESLPAAAAEPPIPADDATELVAPETMIDPAPVPAAEQEPDH